MAKEKSAFDRVQFVMMDNEIDIYKLADKLLVGDPLMVNFESFDDIESNKILSFLSGVTYSIDGEIEQIQEKIFLFS